MNSPSLEAARGLALRAWRSSLRLLRHPSCEEGNNTTLKSLNPNDDLRRCRKRSIAGDRAQAICPRLREMALCDRLSVDDSNRIGGIKGNFRRTAVLQPPYGEPLRAARVISISLGAKSRGLRARSSHRPGFRKTVIRNR